MGRFVRLGYGGAVAVVAAGVLTSCGWGSSSGGAGGALAAAERAGAQAAAVRVDLSDSQGAFPFHPGRQLSATPNSWKYGAKTDAELSALKLAKTRVWLEFDQAYDVKTRTPDYAKWYDYLDTYASRSQSLVVNWRSDYDPLVTGGTFSRAQLMSAEVAMLADYKRHSPTIGYLEAENEPSDIAAYYPKYKFLYQVVNAVNAKGLPGPRIKIGGPTTDIFTTYRIGKFLDLYAEDDGPHKRLDFVSYHQYLINTVDGKPWDRLKKDPAVVSTERKQLNAMLADHGMSPRPALVTETGVFPGSRKTDLGLHADYHIQAAGLAALHYYYLGEKDVTPFHWTVDHPDNDRKDLFADTDTGAARPYYNMVRMQSMLPDTRYKATSDALSAKGIGVYGLAGAEAGRVAVMTWNYQWTGTTTYDRKIVLSHFSGAFRTSNVLVTRYKIDADLDTGDLKPVEQFVIKPRSDGGYTSQTLALRPNELRLLVLTPTDKPVGWHS